MSIKIGRKNIERQKIALFFCHNAEFIPILHKKCGCLNNISVRFQGAASKWSREIFLNGFLPTSWLSGPPWA
jgi:hypothetical protein